MRKLPVLLVAGAVALPGAATLDAQIRASEHATVSQTVDGTTITVEYSRPQARGRALFGELVPWDVVWTPGANWATTLSVDADVRVNGEALPAGTYSVWAIPRPGRFTITFNPTDSIFHFMKPDSTDEQIHVSAQPQEIAHTEMLTWTFPAVSGDAAQLAMRWGTTSVPLQIVVPPSKPATLTPDQLAQYEGEYDLSLTEGIGWPTEARLEIHEQGGRLRGRLPFPMHPGDELVFDMVPAGGDRFNPGLYHGEELFNVEIGVIFDFSEADEAGRSNRLALRSPNGFHLGFGTRVAGSGATSR